MNDYPQIVVGTYEEFVLGYKIKNENEVTKMLQTFAAHSHQASVRCVATHKHLMASSGADEYINIYDMIAMKVLTVINYHNSTVTCLEFTPDGSHLVTANQNGDIAIFRCEDWSLVKLWKEAHKHANGVLGISIHPSGTLLITAGADNIVRFWNLVKGRQAYATNFSKKCSVGNSLNFVLWSKNGIYYAVCIGNKVEVYKTETAAVVYELSTKTRVTCVIFTKKNLVCVGTEDGKIEIHSLVEKKMLHLEEAHKARVKSMATFELRSKKNNGKKLQNYIVSAESKGSIKIWHLKKKEHSLSLILKCDINCDCRITCLTIVAPAEIKKENIIETVSKEVDVMVDISEENSPISSNRQNNVLSKKNKTMKRKWQVTTIESSENSLLEKSAKEMDKTLENVKKSSLISPKKKKRKFLEINIQKSIQNSIVDGNKNIKKQVKKKATKVHSLMKNHKKNKILRKVSNVFKKAPKM